ncbi:MAG: hypothetical protein LAP87_06670 [Acidobacteriia bacterium]|nr:hypothetical protein [Terriglobia bacterium]
MSVGQILLQPQKLRRVLQRAPESAILDDLVTLALLLAEDAAGGGPLPAAMERALAEAAAKLVARIEAGVSNAAVHLTAFFQPLLTKLQGVALATPGDAAAAADAFMQSLADAIGWLKNLSAPQVRGGLETVFGILERDLGFTPDAIEQWIWDFLDGMAGSLEQPAEGETAQQRSRRREAAAILRRLRREAQPLFQFPKLDADRAAQALLDVLKRPEVDSALGRAACIGKAAATGVHLGHSIVDLAAPAPPPQQLLRPVWRTSAITAGPRSAAPAPAPAAANSSQPVQIGYYASKLLTYQNWDGDWGALPDGTDQNFNEGYMLPELRAAFRPLSIVLSRYSFLVVADENKKWKVTDRKQYIIKKQASTLVVFPLCEVGTSDFASAAADLTALCKLFKENGILLTENGLTVSHGDGNSWDIQESGSGHHYQAVRLSGTVTLYPLDRLGIFFELPFALLGDLKSGPVSTALAGVFQQNDIILSPRARLAVRDGGDSWTLDDGEFEFTVKRDDNKLKVGTGNWFSWIFANLVSWPQGEKVWVSPDRTQVLLGQRIIHTGTGVTWQSAPIFSKGPGNSYYSFAKMTADQMDTAAYVALCTQDIGNIVMYALTIALAKKAERKYTATSNSLNIGRSLSEFIAKVAFRRSVSDFVGIQSQAWKEDYGWWYDFLQDVGIKIAGLIETIIKAVDEPSAPDPPNPPNTFSKFMDTFLGIITNRSGPDTYWVGLAYEFFLSFLTLNNHQEPKDAATARPENFKEIGGFLDPIWNIGVLIYCMAIPSDMYALPFETTVLTLHCLLGMLGMGLVTGLLGWILGQLVLAGAPAGADGMQVVKILLKAWGKSTAAFFPYLKLVKRKG